jgi:hypothetical protein
MFIGCSVEARWIAIDVRWMFVGCSLEVPSIRVGSSIYIRWMVVTCGMDFRWIFDRCSLEEGLEEVGQVEVEEGEGRRR